MATVSVDLAYKDHRDIGIAVLRGALVDLDVAFVQPPLAGEPRPRIVAEYLASLCEQVGARRLLIDGPQAWKSPDNGLVHARVCEHQLHTPAKTGLPGAVKPANYVGFVVFSIEVFDALDELGWRRFDGRLRADAPTAFESFPLAAWRCLGLAPLPAKSRTSPDLLRERTEQLAQACGLDIPPVSSHDELQALVAGLAGPALESGESARLRLAGVAPFVLDGLAREGFIVCPAAAAGAAAEVAGPGAARRNS